MKRIIVIVVLIVISLLLLFLSQDKDTYYISLAQKAVSLYNGDYNLKNIKRKDQEAFQDFYKTLTHEGGLVDIDNYFQKDIDYKVSSANSQGIIWQNNKCYIKYASLTIWNNKERDDMANFQRVVCNGYETILLEDYFLPPYDHIVNSPKYDYVLSSYDKSLNGYTFNFNSSYDDTLLVIKFTLQNGKVTSIKAIY